MYAYVGCRTTKERNARGKGLKTYEISESTGEWKELQWNWWKTTYKSSAELQP